MYWMFESQGSWSLNCNYFSCIVKVEDQMVLLQSCWSELLVLDHLCRQVAYGKESCIYLVTGQQVKVKGQMQNLFVFLKFDFMSLKCCAETLTVIAIAFP